MTETSVLLQAGSIALTKPAIAALAASAPVDRLVETLSQALEEGRMQAATSLAFAVGAAGGRLPAALAARLVPDLENIAHLPAIISIIEGDRIAAMLDIVEAQRISWEREALLLFLASQLLGDDEPPARLIAQLRTLARNPIDLTSRMLLGLAARTLRNPEIDRLMAPYLPIADLARRDGVDTRLLESFHRPVIDSLPETADRVMVSGYTFTREEPKVGRNDPCPCGSGKKYKKCCAGKAQELPAQAETLLAQYQKLAARGQGDRIFGNLRPADLMQLDPATLTTIQIIDAIRKLSLNHRWDGAERLLDVLASRTDIPRGSDPGEFRLEVIDEALGAGEVDLAERQIALANLDVETQDEFRMRLALARKLPAALEELERALQRGLAGHTNHLYASAFALLDHSPALGILVARGCIDPERLLDSETLLMEIDRARDRLGLSATEPWWDVFDAMLEAESENEHRAADDRSSRRREEELAEMRDDLKAANARVNRLDSELRKRTAELDSLAAGRRADATPAPSIVAADDTRRTGHEDETRRLRAKIAELKGEISEGATQRAELRRKLAEAADRRRADLHGGGHRENDAERHEGDDADELEGETASRPRRILVPRYTAAATRALKSIPSRVAADALGDVARLGGGDPNAWSGVKHMRRAHHILSARVGRTYRLLFTTNGEELEVVDLIHRRDLEAAMQRLVGR